MLKSRKHKFVSIITALSVLSITNSSMMTSAALYTTPLDAYINTVLPVYVQNDINETSYISLSNKLDLHDYETNSEQTPDMYLVLKNDIIIGALTIGIHNGEYYSSYESNNGSNDMFETLQSCYNSNTKVSLANSTNNVSVYCENTADNINDSSFNYTSIDIDKTITVQPRSAIYSIQLNTSRVANETYNNRGLCWAAVIATVFNYYGTHSSPMPASYVRYTLENKYGSTPIGTPTWILCGYDHFLGEVLGRDSFLQYNGMMTYNEIIAQLQNDNPIHMSLSNEESDLYHGVLLSGVTLYNGYATYYIDDPNSSTTAHTAVYVSSATMNATADFTYYASVNNNTGEVVRSYISWYRSFY